MVEKLKDFVYKEVEIDEPVLSELLHSPTVLRLKGITQAGVPQQFNSIETYDRYEHSVGVMLLLKRLGCSTEEQVAGLLHDISHLAFSHVAEWVFQEEGSTEESLNETMTQRFLDESELKGLLEKYDHATAKISDFSNYPILKKGMPDLNADRVDYSLREIGKWIDPALPSEVIDDLVLRENTIVFQTPEVALKYSLGFLNLQQNYWGSYDSVMRYHLFSTVLRKMVHSKVLTMEDFLGEEAPIVKRIAEQTDPEITSLLSMLEQKDLTGYQGTVGQKVRKKFRYIDPLVMTGSDLTRLTKLSTEYKSALEKALKVNKKGIDI